jgi:hypothetical protein
MDIGRYFTDRDAVENGRWFPLDADTEIKVARWANSRFTVLEARLKSRLVGLPAREIPGRQADEIAVELIVETIILDWRGKFILDGAPLPYSKANARKVLFGSAWFRNKVAFLAMDESGFFRQDAAAPIEAAA